MTQAAALQTAVRTQPQSAGGHGLLPQRKCACGAKAGPSSAHCDECSKRSGTLHAKLRIGGADDVLERDADHAADRALASITPALPTADQGTEPLVRRRAAGAGGTYEAAASAGDALSASGAPLDGASRQFFESRFQHDFSRVRVHVGGTAEKSADDIGARAFTVGNDVVFARGEYAPHSHAGRHLLAHELAHVVQQQSIPARVQRVERESAVLGKHSEPIEVAKWGQQLKGQGYTVVENARFHEFPWLKKAFPHKNTGPDMVAWDGKRIVVGDITGGPHSDASQRGGFERKHPNELKLEETRPHFEKTIADAEQLARNLPDEMKHHEVVAQERWWAKGGRSPVKQVKAPNVPFKVPAAPKVPASLEKPNLPLAPPGKTPNKLGQWPPSKVPFRIYPNRIEGIITERAKEAARFIWRTNVTEAGRRAGGKLKGSRGAVLPHPGQIAAEILFDKYMSNAQAEAMQKTVLEKVNTLIATKHDEIEALANSDPTPRWIFAYVTWTTKPHIMGEGFGPPTLESVTVEFGTKSIPDDYTRVWEDSINFRDVHKFSFQVVDVRKEMERQALEAEKERLDEELAQQVKAREQRKKAADEKKRQGKGPLKPPPEQEEAKPAAPRASPQEFFKPPPAQDAPQPIPFFPAIERDPRHDRAARAERATTMARKLANHWIKQGLQLRDSDPPAEQRKTWRRNVREWFTAVKAVRVQFQLEGMTSVADELTQIIRTEGAELREIYNSF